MQLTTTDYATRIICCLAQNKEIMSATVLSSKLDIPMSYIFKVAKLLRQAELIRSLDGLEGGYALAKEPSEITLMDVVLASEKTMNIIHCLDNQGYCSGEVSVNCRIRIFYEELQETIQEKMSITIANLIASNGGDG